jgi:hypothetical protein
MKLNADEIKIISLMLLHVSLKYNIKCVSIDNLIEILFASETDGDIWNIKVDLIKYFHTRISSLNSIKNQLLILHLKSNSTNDTTTV